MSIQLILKTGFLAVFLGVLPLCFGGAHHTTWYIFCGLALLCVAVFFPRATTGTDSDLKHTTLYASISTRELSLLALVCVLLIGVSVYHVLRTMPHPVLGTISVPVDLAPVAGFFSGLILLLAPVLIFSNRDERIVHRSILLSGCAVATISLAQWLSDNGLLLWTFAPHYVFESTRARWPFVNPNHLGAFLLAPLFLSTRAVLVWLIAATSNVQDIQHRSRRRVYTFPFQASITLIFTGTALLASQSRSAWGAGVIGVAALIGMQVYRAKISRVQRLSVCVLGVILAAALAWGLSFSDRLAVLTTSRIETAATSSLDDVRFKYLVDAWSLYQTSPLLGIGPGGFVRDIETVVRPELAGLNPQYLHNEVLQFFLEYGLLAGLAVCGIAYLALRSVSFPISICLVGIFLISLLDFPFRIGALVAQLGLLYALGKIQRIR